MLNMVKGLQWPKGVFEWAKGADTESGWERSVASGATYCLANRRHHKLAAAGLSVYLRDSIWSLLALKMRILGVEGQGGLGTRIIVVYGLWPTGRLRFMMGESYGENSSLWYLDSPLVSMPKSASWLISGLLGPCTCDATSGHRLKADASFLLVPQPLRYPRKPLHSSYLQLLQPLQS